MPLLVKFYNLYDDLVIRDACFADDYEYVLFVIVTILSLMTYHLITMIYHRIVDISIKMGVASRAGIVQSSWSSDFTSVISGGFDFVCLVVLIYLAICIYCLSFYSLLGPSWLWSYGSWIYNYLCNQCISPLKLRVRTLFMARCTRYNIRWSSVLWYSGLLHQ